MSTSKNTKNKTSQTVKSAKATSVKAVKETAELSVKPAGKRVVAARKVVTPAVASKKAPAPKKAQTTLKSSSSKNIHDRPQTTSEWAHIRHSKIHGRGIVATKDIPSGTRIIEYEGERISKAVSERRDEEREARAAAGGDGCVYIFEINKRTDLDGHMEWNTARLINHSCEPNCQSENLRGHIWLSAVRDIAAGEELTFDYGFDVENWKAHRCLCGSQKCVGYIVAKSHRWRLKKKLKKEKQALRATRVK